MIERDFGSLDALKTKFAAQTVAVQGSGWGWLGYDKVTGKLAVATTANQDPCSTTGPRARSSAWTFGSTRTICSIRTSDRTT